MIQFSAGVFLLGLGTSLMLCNAGSLTESARVLTVVGLFLTMVGLACVEVQP